MFSISEIAGCNMKYQILRYFNISCSLGRNDRLSGVGSKILLLKKLIIFVFFLYIGKYFTILVLL